MKLSWHEHIDLAQHIIKLQTSKTGQLVQIPLHPKLQEWLESVPDKRGNLIPKSKIQYSTTVGAFVYEAAGERFTPHELRHTFASSIKSDKMRQLMLGHSNLSTTNIYTHFSQEEVSQAVAAIYDSK